METLTAIISAAMVSIFVQNAIFERAFGSNVAIYASRKENHVSGFTIGITAIISSEIPNDSLNVRNSSGVKFADIACVMNPR